VRTLRTPRRAARTGSDNGGLTVSRREMLVGGIGAGALIALPDLSLSGRSSARSTTPAALGSSASRYVLVYGVPDSAAPAGGSVAAAIAPASRSASLPAAKPVAATLAAAPVLSPDQSAVALVTVDSVSGGAKVTLTLVESATAAVLRQGSVTITGIPEGTSIVPKPVFAPGTSTVAVVLAVTEPSAKRLVTKRNPRTGAAIPMQAVTWTSHHELAYFDTSNGDFAGPFSLDNAPALGLTTAAANGSDLFLWSTAEPQPISAEEKRKGTWKAPLPWVSAFSLGSGQARLSVPSPGPWASGEPVVTLASGDVARLVNGRTIQVSSAQTGEVTQTTIAPLAEIRAKPSSLTMESRADGTVFITKPGIGQAVVVDPSDSFRVTAQVSYPAPAAPLSAPSSKAVLSPDGGTLYVVGGAKTGGIAAYDVSTGKLAGSYSSGRPYSGLYQLASGTLLALSPANPRLEFFSQELSPIGSVSTSLQVSAVY
jgi:hypothetical protein